MIASVAMPRTISVVMLLMAFSSLVGFFALGYRMKTFGYPDSDALIWASHAVFLRSHGLWMIPLSVVWGVCAWAADRRYGDGRLYKALVCAGLAVATIVTYAFVDAAVHPGYVPLRF